MRRVLRSVRVPPSKHPHRYRASTLGWWWWCAERSRHYALNLIERKPPSPQSKIGTVLHEILAEQLGRRFPWEDEFMDKLESIQDPEVGFARKFGDAKIYDNITGHPDDFQVSLDGDVTILEHKTSEIGKKEKDTKFWEHYMLPKAEFQLKVYCWIFSKLFEKKELEGYRLARTHAVLYWLVIKKEKRVQLKDVYHFTYYPRSVEADIKYAIAAYANPKMIIKPRPWKCKQCPKVHKAVCQFEQNNPFEGVIKT